MPINIEMPKLSDTMTEGTVVSWLKKVGDQVDIGDVIAEIETDKATMEMEAFDEGTIAEILVEAGGKGAVGSVIAVIAEEGEDVSEISGASGGKKEEADDSGKDEKSEKEESKKKDDSKEKEENKKEDKEEKKTAGKSEKESGGKSSSDDSGDSDSGDKSSSAAKRGQGERILASPLARKMAEGKGIDLASLSGSGPGGRIVKVDVEKGPSGGSSAKSAPAGGGGQSAPSAAAPAAEAIKPTAGEEDTRVELSTMRKIIAERLLTSKQTIPHFYLHMEVDMAPLMALRKQVNVQAEQTHGNKYTINDFIVKSMINAAVSTPEVNASYAGDHIVQFAHVGISVAVAVEDGLVTPVVKKAQEKSLLQISKEIKDLAVRARDKKLKPNEFDGGTITVSNLGAWGVDSFDAIVNPPQAAILSVGGISEKPVVKDGEIVPGTRMNIGLSCDHRVVDGAVGAKYLGEIKRLLENPALMLI